MDCRTDANPRLTLSAPLEDIVSKILGNAVSVSNTIIQQQSQGGGHQYNQAPSSSCSGSPHSLLESLSATTRSVPATPLGISGSGTHLTLCRIPTSAYDTNSLTLNYIQLTGHDNVCSFLMWEARLRLH